MTYTADDYRKAADVWESVFGGNANYSQLSIIRSKASRMEVSARQVEELALWLSVNVGNWAEDEWPMRAKPTLYHDKALDLLSDGRWKRVEE